MSKSYPNEGNMHFIYGVKTSNSLSKNRKRNRNMCVHYTYKGICNQKICKCKGITGCKFFEQMK